MISYLYWFCVAALVFLVLFGLGARLGKWKPAAILAVILVVLSTLLYYFYLEQMFVKRWGGSMAIRVPAGQLHMGATWKGDNLWIQNYDPQENVCIFSEYARGNLLEGRVILRDCNPMLPAFSGAKPEAVTGPDL
ncbi:hypothetical protein [Alcanivorax quisquiliarum]|uniref:Uncharacterized protein n=1 Tax=Alcanivorax quisquiliarum TaxID=2933565 RepID=A0ABT0E527_9GAMM|nr:hypothetical protein [Alcanivorax quisquiliarum]MCK0536895.1 hypothetical protein [Alcanivorax quisquiliarum]